MKTTHLATALLLTLLPAFSQTGGPLFPPEGLPGPVMKSLDQIEPRIPLVEGAPGVSIAGSGTITILEPGSYYLTGNLTVTGGHGIAIGTSDVALDLMGFTIGTDDSYYTNDPFASGITLHPVVGRNISIHNGHIASSCTYEESTFSSFGGGFVYGIRSNPGTSPNITIRNVSVTGVVDGGIHLPGSNALVDSCTVETAGYDGIHARLVRNCIVSQIGGIGISAAQVENCRATSVGYGSAISASLVSHSFGQYTGTSTDDFFHGIQATIVNGSYGVSSGGDGISSSRLVSRSYGSTTKDSSFTCGISCAGTVENSTGISTHASGGAGISASIAKGSHGESNGDSGIAASRMVSQSYGTTARNHSSAHGISCTGGAVESSTGISTHANGGAGISALMVKGSYGESNGDNGITASRMVSQSTGISKGASSNDHGIYCQSGRVDHCHGIAENGNSGHGIQAFYGSVTNSTGYSYRRSGINAAAGMIASSHGRTDGDGASGLFADLVVHSRGERGVGGSGTYSIHANTAVGCYIVGTPSITHRYNMP